MNRDERVRRVVVERLERLERRQALAVIVGEQILQTVDVVDGRSQCIDFARSPTAAATCTAGIVTAMSTIPVRLLMLTLPLLPAVTRQSISQRRERDVDQLDAPPFAQVASFDRLGCRNRRRRRHLTCAIKPRRRRRFQRRAEASFTAQNLTIFVVC